MKSINDITTNIKVSRADICDLLEATAEMASLTNGDERRKWDNLHNKVFAQLQELDNKIDFIRYEVSK